MPEERTLKGLDYRRALYGPAAYLAIALLVYVVTALTTNPDNVGLDWIPFVTLAMPWYKFNPQLLFVGIFINAGILYLFGLAVEGLRQRLLK